MYDRQPVSPPLRIAAGLALTVHVLFAVVDPPFRPSPVPLAHSLVRPPTEVVKYEEIVDFEPFPRPVLSPHGVSPVEMPDPVIFEPTLDPEIDPPLPPDVGFGSGGEAWQAGMVLRRGVKPTVLKRVEPRYPEMARRAGAEGVVELEVLVGTKGRAAEVRITHSTGSEILERAAEEAIRRWVFAPAKQGDKSVAAWVRIRFRFEM